jgi:hypothetical protein
MMEESDKENHPPNRPKPVVTQGDAKLSLQIKLLSHEEAFLSL